MSGIDKGSEYGGWEEPDSELDLQDIAMLNLSTDTTLAEAVAKLETKLRDLKENPSEENVNAFLEECVLEFERIVNVYVNNLSLLAGQLSRVLDAYPLMFDDEAYLRNTLQNILGLTGRIEILVAELRGIVDKFRRVRDVETFSAELNAWRDKLMENLEHLETLESELLEAVAEMDEYLQTEQMEVQGLEDIEQEDMLEGMEGDILEVSNGGTETVELEPPESVEDVEDIEDMDEEPSPEEVEALMNLDESELSALIDRELKGVYDDLEELKRYVDESEEDIDIYRELSAGEPDEDTENDSLEDEGDYQR